ncbi:bifunctional oligoribonuclease/PAP phosphatase NrnA [Streptosporangiaceae bacterium NEAU-GS5]|nr:bifunctional oligoribonuclease/PAP phosphatase NrnA [Streptosporangiaceae bacterium NEAU-GS5]
MTHGSTSTGSITPADWDRAVALIREADTLALACHVSPDGDALGSMLAFGLALRAAGKKAVCSFGDRDFAVPRLLRFLPGQELLAEPSAYPDRPELMITFDASTMQRLGLLMPCATAAGELVVIDHHASNSGFGTLHLIDPAAAATAVVTEELLHRLGMPVDRAIATCLYTGLVTDTGSFRYSSTTPSVHAMAGRLLATGINQDAIARELWDRAPYSYLAVLGGALQRAVLDPDGHGMVWTYISCEDRGGLPYGEIEGIIDVVRKVDEADVAVVLKQGDDGVWNVSTRSKGAVDVARACSLLGGGGHRMAAGFSSELPPAETVARLKELLA